MQNCTVEQAERSLLGALLLEPEYFDEIYSKIKPDDFSEEQSRSVFGAFVDLTERGYSCDILSICRYLETKGVKNVTPGALGSMMNPETSIPVSSLIPEYAEIVRSGARQRRVMEATKGLMSATMRGNEEEITAKIKHVSDVWDSDSVESICSLSEAAHEYVKQLISMEKGDHPRWKTGMALFDDVCNQGIGGGLQPGQLLVACGRAGAGKTTAALFLVREMCRLNPDLEALFFSLELSAPAIGGKLIRTEMHYDKAKSFLDNASDSLGRLTSTYGDRIQVLDHTGMTPSKILATARRMAKQGVKLFVVDHLHRVAFPTASAKDLRHHIDAFCKALTDFAKDHDAFVIICAQLNREPEKQQRAPMMSDIAECGGIEQHADMILAVYSEPSRKDVIKFGLIKNRHGPEVTRTFKVSWKHQRFLEMEG